MKILSAPPYHTDSTVREALYEMALGATLAAAEDFEAYVLGKRNVLHGDYLYQEKDNGIMEVYAHTLGGYVYVGILDKVSETFLPALKEVK